MISVIISAAGIAVLAGVGTLLRYGLSLGFNNEFPVGTLIANLVASFAFAVLATTDGRLGMVVGVGALGALSTWSTVANEAAIMARNEQGALAVAYLSLTVSSGVLAAWLGLQVARLI